MVKRKGFLRKYIGKIKVRHGKDGKMLNSQHIEDLKRSGLIDQTIEASGIYSATAEQITVLLGFKVKSAGMVIPYPGIGMVTVKPNQTLLDKKGRPAKYLRPKGSQNRLYIPLLVKDVLQDTSKPLGLTEGEKKALKACQEGLPCIGISGCWNFRTKKESGESCPIQDLDLIAWKGRIVYLILDSDARTNSSVMRAGNEFAQLLIEKGADVKLIVLPKLDQAPESKTGLDDYLIKCTVTDLLSLDVEVLDQEKSDLFPRGTIALFENLIDIVILDNKPVYLIRDGKDLKCIDSYENDGKLYGPPIKEMIPFEVVRAEDVLELWKLQPIIGGGNADRKLLSDLEDILKKTAQMPRPGFYLLLALWVLHTYVHENFEYSPQLILEGLPERGKSRMGKRLIHLSYRGITLVSLNEAILFRLSQRYHVTLFADIMDVWAKAEKQNATDILLNRFERGGKVVRVVDADKGDFKDVRFYDVYGPTIFATNEPLHKILETRGILATMPKSLSIFMDDVKYQDTEGLKISCLIFRARHISSDFKKVDKPCYGRLGDIMVPLLSILKTIAPEREQELMDFIKETEGQRKVDKQDTLEGHIYHILCSLTRKREYGKVTVADVVGKINETRQEKEKVSSGKVGRRLKAMGFKMDRDANARGYLITEEVMNTLASEYGGITSQVSETSLGPNLSILRPVYEKRVG